MAERRQNETEREVLRYVRDSEYRRESARQIADRILSEANGRRFVFDGEDEAVVLLAALLLAIRQELVPFATRDAAQHAERMGLPRLSAADASAIAERAVASVADEGAALLADRVAEIDRQIVAIADQVSPESGIKALESRSATRALTSLLSAILRSTGAGAIARVEQEIQKAALAMSRELDPEGALEFRWQTREDGRECDDVFEDSCSPRNSFTRTLGEWEQVGTPGAPNLLCSIYARGAFSWCRCALIPAQRNGPAVGDIPRERFSRAVEAGRIAAKAKRK